jgi:hypothetical protein
MIGILSRKGSFVVIIAIRLLTEYIIIALPEDAAKNACQKCRRNMSIQDGQTNPTVTAQEREGK